MLPAPARRKVSANSVTPGRCRVCRKNPERRKPSGFFHGHSSRDPVAPSKSRRRAAMITRPPSDCAAPPPLAARASNQDDRVTVASHRGVMGHPSQGFRQRLGDEDAVERVAMIRRECLDHDLVRAVVQAMQPIVGNEADVGRLSPEGVTRKEGPSSRLIGGILRAAERDRLVSKQGGGG